jgi:RHS repeat-associated protein
MLRNTLSQIARAAVVATAIAAFQDVREVCADPGDYTAQAMSRVPENRPGHWAFPESRMNELGRAVLDADGRIIENGLGALICRYTYDGLGRLARKTTPVNQGQTELQHKDFYYDGVRRIAEVITRPPEPGSEEDPPGGGEEGLLLLGGEENNELAAQWDVNQDGIADSQQDLDGDGYVDGQPEQQIMESSSGGASWLVWTDREYIYGPDYVDEFVCQIDARNQRIFMLADANYNNIALVSGGSANSTYAGPGADSAPVLPAAGTLLEQYTYEPYGTVLAADSFVPHAVNRVGHQGLFFERFDGTYTTGTLADGAAGLYYNRNRFYDPKLGRFTARDPNETGVPILSSIEAKGWPIDSQLYAFNGHSLYKDGLNLYSYQQSNTLSGHDPLGLSLGLSLVLGVSWGEGARYADAESSIAAGHFAGWKLMTKLALYYLTHRIAIESYENFSPNKGLSKRQCDNLKAWCLYNGGQDCWTPWRFCQHNGKWPDLPEYDQPGPNAHPDVRPPGYE